VLAGAGGPNWVTGSPQHFVVGAVLAFAVYWAARSDRIRLPEWAAVAVAVGLVSAAELVWEIVEYEVRYAGHFHYSAYYDTLADLANSFAGAVVGVAAGAALRRLLVRRR
jgi:multisubunit Na+/H+ antiporter MnhE subunit